MSTSTVDLGHKHTLRFFEWRPERDLNPQYDGIADVEKAGAIVEHEKSDGSPCSGAIHFDTMRGVPGASERVMWTVESWEPLTLSPSLLCACGDHGFVRNGRWEPC